MNPIPPLHELIRSAAHWMMQRAVWSLPNYIFWPLLVAVLVVSYLKGS